MVARIRPRIKRSAIRPPIRRLGHLNSTQRHRHISPNSSVSVTATSSPTSPLSSSYSSYSSSNSNPSSPSHSVSYTPRSISSPSDSISYTPHSVASLHSSSLPSNLVTPVEEEYYVPIAPLPIFRGDSDECPFMHMKRYDNFCRANNVNSPAMAARVFPASLGSIAALWYDISIGSSMPWDAIRSEFLSSFKLPDYKLRSELFSLCQSNEETVNHYHLRLQFILTKWPNNDLSDETLKSIFIDGLRKELKEWVLPQGPITLDEAFKLAISWEQVEEIREAREKALKREIKCGFCGFEGHEEGFCEVSKKMRMLWARSSFKASFVNREGNMDRLGKTGSLKRQCSCPKHQCWKKIERSESVKSEKEEFYDAAQE